MNALKELLGTGIPWVAAGPSRITSLGCAAILLFLAAVLTMSASRRAWRKRVPVSRPKAGQKDPIEMEREFLRLNHRVRPLNILEETFTLREIPGGTYGFMLIPAKVNSPVLKKSDPGLFEVHKTTDHAILVVGFTSPQTVLTLETAGEEVSVTLFANPTAEASELVSIPLAPGVRCKHRCSRQQNVLQLGTEPAHAWKSKYQWTVPRKPLQAQPEPAWTRRTGSEG